MRRVSIVPLIIFIIICEAAGVVGSLFTMSSLTTWYASISKPSFTPPGWIIGAVWIVLYFLMAVSAYLVFEKGVSSTKVKTALYAFGIQLIINVLWSVSFFGLRNITLGFAVIVLLWFAVLATIILFYKTRKSAAVIMLPYIFWVTFAAVLNYLVLVLNL